MDAKKILVVDDDIDILTVVEARLKTQGYNTIVGHNGTEALSLAKEHHPDLIVMDVTMPPPNGYQVCRTLKDDPDYESIPIILLTSKGTDSDKFWGIESGADEYITKPYNSEEFLAKVAEILK